MLVSSMHTVLPGKSLSVTLASVLYDGFAVADPDTMHYLTPSPPNPRRSQARIDVYDAGDPGFPSAASLQAPVFYPTNIQAVPYLGSLIGDAGFTDVARYRTVITVKFSLAPYVGETVYFADRTSSNVNLAYANFMADYVISC